MDKLLPLDMKCASPLHTHNSSSRGCWSQLSPHHVQPVWSRGSGFAGRGLGTGEAFIANVFKNGLWAPLSLAHPTATGTLGASSRPSLSHCGLCVCLKIV